MKILNENPKSQVIKDKDDWLRYCPPEGGEKQWKPDHSAMEFAKLVTSSAFEDEICDVLKESEFGECSIEKAFPERLTSFDKFGGPRHHDLACIVKSKSGKFVLGFEAKANEDFDDSLTKHINDLISKNTNSRILDRVNFMTQRFWQKDYDEATMRDLRYQLLTGLTGTIFFAEEQRCKKCVFVIYQIKTNETSDDCIKNHKDDILNFLKMFSKNFEKLEENKIYPLGNFHAEKSDIGTYLLYIKRDKLN